MPPSRFTQYGGAAGADQALQQMVAERIAAQMEQRKQAIEAYKLQQQDRQIGQGDVRNDLTGRGLDLEQARLDRPQAPVTLAPGGRLISPSDGRVIAEAPDRPLPPERPMSLAPGGRLISPSTGEVIASSPAAQAQPNQEPLIPVMGPDGKPVLMPRSRAAGMQPASTREQGRPVTSGDAGRLADLDTSLNDLATLKDTIPAGATGTRAKVGAMVPNFVTEATGFGEAAKSKQATIDRVKQVIGKALEDGVLRKEDEIKYEKILPTIGDVDSVVATKLAGLERAITQRRQTMLDALQDANYDTTNFTNRERSQAPQGDVKIKSIRQVR